MKRLISLLLMCVLSTALAWAVPSRPKIMPVKKTHRSAPHRHHAHKAAKHHASKRHYRSV